MFNALTFILGYFSNDNLHTEIILIKSQLGSLVVLALIWIVSLIVVYFTSPINWMHYKHKYKLKFYKLLWLLSNVVFCLI
jgi:hypothetical protein